MGVHIIKVPDIGEGIAEVELVAWHVAVGDAVAPDQALADVMTEKATVEIPSPVAGRVLALGGEVGAMVAVGAELIRIEVGGDTAAAAAAPAPAASPTPAPRTAPAPIPSLSPSLSPSPSPSLSPSPSPSPAISTARPIASPALRRRAWELGIDLKDVRGSGSAGRIMQADLDAHIAAHGVRPSAQTAPPPVPPAPASRLAVARHAERGGEQAIPVIGLRRRIALKMQEAKRRIPHFSYVEEIDVTELEALRAALNAKWQDERGRLTLLPLLMRAIVLAVAEFPQINARFDDEAGVITRFGAVHLGVATQTAHGLMVPVLRHAESRDLWATAAEVARLAEAARTGRALRDELSGSTITISSLGALGGIVSTPVINRPEVAIVAVNRIVERPVIRAGAVVARSIMNLSSSFDHRVVDGIDGAQFVQALRTLLETPALLFIE
ncbi:MAG: dihydrolipoamide acetyltransferase family protein [Caldimonas sp.]